ncbi:MAG: DUF3299 domain-containing protein [Variovorax sp.]
MPAQTVATTLGASDKGISSRMGRIAGVAALTAITAALGLGFYAWQAPPAQAAQPLSKTASDGAAPVFKEVPWEALVPKEWDPLKRYRGMDLNALEDGSDKATDLLADMRAAWDNAPTVAAMDGAAVKLPGYLVPLEEVKGELKEFLLVPYFGACIHTPPPPANQIIHVTLAQPVKGFRSMDAVWISGKLETLRQNSDMGMSGYRMHAVRVDHYSGPPPNK